MNRKTRRAVEQGKIKPQKEKPSGSNRTLIVKGTIPRIISDNPMFSLCTRDGSFVETMPINQQIVKWMNGDHEAYFELVMSSTKIISMTRVSESRYSGTEHSILKMVTDEP